MDNESHTFYGNGIATSNSHAYEYAINGFISAYHKCHFPRAFFIANLRNSLNKPDQKAEVFALVNEARTMGIEIMPPNIFKRNKNFEIVGSGISFGMMNVKYCGKSVCTKLSHVIKEAEATLNKSFADFSYIDCLFFILPNINSNAAEAMIGAGAFNQLGIDRAKMLFDFNLVKELSNKEYSWLCRTIAKGEELVTLVECLQKMVEVGSGRDGSCANKKRLQEVKEMLKSLIQPSYSMVSSNNTIIDKESRYLGAVLSCSKVNAKDTQADTTCQQYDRLPDSERVIFVVGTIDEIKEIMTKNQEPMAFLTISDDTGCIDSTVVFPDCWDENKHLLIPTNTVLFAGKKKNDSLIVQNCWQA